MIKKFEEFIINEGLWKSGIKRSESDKARLDELNKEGVFIELKSGKLIDQKDWETSGKTESDIKGIYVSDGERKITLSLKQSPKNLPLSTQKEFPQDYPGIENHEDGKLCQKWMEEHYSDLSHFPAFDYCKKQGGYLMSKEEGKLLEKYYREITGTAGRLLKNGIDADGLITDTVVFLEDGSFKLRNIDDYSDKGGEEVKVIGIERHDKYGNLWFSSIKYDNYGYHLYVHLDSIVYFSFNHYDSLARSYVVRPALY